MGAHQTIDSRDPDAIEAAAGTFDLILSTVNVKLDWNGYVAALRPKGRMHFVGATVEPLDLSVFLCSWGSARSRPRRSGARPISPGCSPLRRSTKSGR